MSDATAGNGNETSKGPLTERVLEFVEIMKERVAKGRKPGFTVDDWAPLAALLDVDAFERVGPFRDAMRWAEYSQMLTQWVTTSEGWDPVVKRITEAPGLVYLQCEEMVTNGDEVDPFHSLTIYRFDDAGKICGIEVYMQQEMKPPI